MGGEEGLFPVSAYSATTSFDVSKLVRMTYGESGFAVGCLPAERFLTLRFLILT